MSTLPVRPACSWFRQCLSATVLATAVLVPSALAQTVDPDAWYADGPVSAIAVATDRVYLGGLFTRLYPPTGACGLLNGVSGVVAEPYGWVNGVVTAAVPDGAGGWYIGGSFSAVRGQPRANLAQLDASGALTPWNPGTNSFVRSLALTANDVIVGGVFTTLGGQARSALGAVDRLTGVTQAWDPNVTGDVFALAISGNSLFIGGDVTAVGGVPRANLALVDLTSGVAPVWNSGTDARVNALALRNATLYIGGEFTTLGGQPRAHLGSVDIVAGALNGWNPGANGAVYVLRTTAPTVVSGPTIVFAGGFFTQLGGQSRTNLGSVDGATGLVTAWAPNPDGRVFGMAVQTNVLGNATAIYAGGEFLHIGGQARQFVGAVTPAGAAMAWNPSADFAVSFLTMAPSGASVFVGGYFNGVGGVVRANLAELDRATGVPTAWNPGTDGEVRALTLFGTTILAGGIFSQVGGVPHLGLAAVDLATGAPTLFTADVRKSGGARGDVNALAFRDGLVYVGGDFQTIRGTTMPNVAAIDPAGGGVALAWPGGTNGPVYALGTTQRNVFPNEVTVYVGGSFGLLGGQGRSNLGSIAAATGLATGWVPNPNLEVRSLLIRPSPLTGAAATIYAGGNFTFIGGQNRQYVAALDLSGVATAWAPQPNAPPIKALAFRGGGILVGGTSFSNIGGATRFSLAEIDATTGLATAWDPLVGGPIATVFPTGNEMYLGGSFFSVHGWERANFARLDETLVGVDDASPAAAGGSIALAAVPNPFRGTAGGEVTISFTLPTAATRADVAIHDLGGRRIRALHAGALAAGATRLVWDGRDDAGRRVATGIYFVRVRAGALGATEKLVRL